MTARRSGDQPASLASPLDRTFLTGLAGVTTVILVRHGQQCWPETPEPVLSDWDDAPLSALGCTQARVVGEWLAAESIDAVYCSGLIRAHDTGRQVARHHGLQPEVVAGLREVDVFRDRAGDLRIRDIMGDPEMAAAQERFVLERRWDVYPFSESSDQFRRRTVDAVETIVGAHRGQTVVVACHSGVINAYLGHILGLSEDMFFRPGHASVSRVLAREGRRVLHSLNETHHLAATDRALVTV